MYRVGVDIGGTFTDWVMADPDGVLTVVKTPTTQDGFSGVFDDIGKASVDGNDIDSIAHGTTLLERTPLLKGGFLGSRWSRREV